MDNQEKVELNQGERRGRVEWGEVDITVLKNVLS